MGGDITVESESGRGLTFTVRLPRIVDAPQEVVTANQAIQDPRIASSGWPRNVSSCEGFRMPAHDGGATYTGGRRTKTSKGGNRDGAAGCAGRGRYGDLRTARDLRARRFSTTVGLECVHNLDVTARILLNGES